MTGKKKNPPPSVIPAAAGKTLRLKAEDALEKQHAARELVAPEDAQRLHHELEVHQIELEIQNEELRRAQEELEAERARYFDLYDLAPVGYVTISEKGLILEANLTACSLLGLKRNKVLRQTLSRYILAEDADIYYLHRKKLFETGKHQVFEVRMLRQDGALFWARIEAAEAQDGETGAPVCRTVLSDITEHKQEEEALRQSEERFENLAEQSGVISWAVDTLGVYTYVSHVVEAVLGYRPEELVGLKYFYDLHPESDREAYKEAAFSYFNRRKPFMHFVNAALTKDGRTVWFSTNGLPILRADGTLQGYSGSDTDITIHRQAEQAVQAKNAELERFTYTVSHDLRSPLVTIKTFLGHLVQDMARANEEQVAQDLGFIHNAADKMNGMLEELLGLSRIGRVVLPSVEAPLQKIVQEALALVAGRISQRGVKVMVAQEPIMLYGDRMRLVEVFQNLIDNAVKFMGEQSDPLIEIGAKAKNGEITCFVRDNGMGIDPRHKDKLFGLFERFHPEVEGTGMGLVQVKRIVEVHGGRIWAESEGLGKGTCFWFSLPEKKIQDSGVRIQD